MRWAALLGVLIAVTVAVPAGAYPAITCGRITVTSKVLIVRTHGPKCADAKRGVRDYLERHRAPKGWTCRAYGAALPVHCNHKRFKQSRYFNAAPAT
jgi:hypothetical protein